jgi:ABC-type Mn2+/Zn2+ transport system permease subunit
MGGVGALLTFTLLVAPGAAVLCLAERFGVAFAIATASSVAATLCGIFVSYWFDLPTGPTIVALLSVLFAVSYAYAALRRR